MARPWVPQRCSLVNRDASGGTDTSHEAACAVSAEGDGMPRRADQVSAALGHKCSHLPRGGVCARQPAYHGKPQRVAGDLAGADYIMRHTVWLGVYPGLTDAHIDYVIATIRNFVRT